MSQMRSFVQVLLVAAALASNPVAATSKLSENRIVSSKVLGYDLQYRVYEPAGSHEELPVLYVADGQWYIEPGGLPEVLDEMIASGEIEPVLAVFVDNRDPHRLSDNRRNQQFFCNRKYSRFYEEELVPLIDRSHPTSANRRDRVILGLSFGGLNSACFGVQAHETFGGIAMQSPAMHPVRSIYSDWESLEADDLRVFLSTGTVNDNHDQAKALHQIIEGKGFELDYHVVRQSHDWKNWGPLLDDVARFFFKSK